MARITYKYDGAHRIPVRFSWPQAEKPGDYSAPYRAYIRAVTHIYRRAGWGPIYAAKFAYDDERAGIMPWSEGAPNGVDMDVWMRLHQHYILLEHRYYG